MGRHVSSAGRRRIAAWPIVLAVVVLLLVGLSITYVLIVNSDKKTASCTGSTVLPVTTSPGSSRAVTDAATAFNATHPIARSTCVSVSVTTVPGAVAASALASGWRNLSTPAPALWIVDSAADVTAVDATDPAMTAGHPNTGLATSPLVLAVRTVPTAPVSWSGLAQGSAPLVITVPDPATNRASGYALESLVAASGGNAAKAIDADGVAGSTSLLQRLALASGSPPPTTSAALAALAAGTGGFTAVPVVESELAAYNAANKAALIAVYPAGATAGDEMMAVPLTASWVNAAMSDAAAAFDAYLGDAKGMATLTADNLRTTGAGAKGLGIDTATRVTPLPDADLKVRTSLQAAWKAAQSPATSTPTSTSTPTASPSTAPVKTTPPGTTKATPTTPTTPKPTTPTPTGPAVTLVLDSSGSMDNTSGTQRRIVWMQAAVTATIAQRPADLFGLYSFSTADGPAGYTSRVALGALADKVGDGTRAAAIDFAVAALTPGGDSWTYGAIRAAYAGAVSTAVAGRPNRVIVLTDGVDTTPDLSRATLLAAIAALAAQNPDVALDIVGLSSDVDTTAMTQIAQSGRGTFTPLTDLSQLQSTVLGLAG